MSVLTDADKGRLFEGILRYARDGEAPHFTGVLAAIWALTKPSIDRDAGRYKEKSLQGRWKVYVREEKKAGREHLDFEEWKHLLLSDDNKCYPTATASSSSTPTSSSAGAPTSTEALPPTHKPFSPPTLQEVQDYVRERNSNVDPQGFIDFYASKGWMVGRSKMKDWRAACRRAEKWDCWGKERDRVRSDAEYYEGWD